MTASITTVVHLSFFVLFCLLCLGLVRGQRRNKELLEFVRGGRKERVYVDWPLRYLSRFCSVFSIDFDGKGSLSSLPPKRLHRDILLETLFFYGVDAIEYLVDSRGDVFLNVFLKKTSPNREMLQNELSTELNMKVTILSKEGVS